MATKSTPPARRAPRRKAAPAATPPRRPSRGPRPRPPTETQLPLRRPMPRPRLSDSDLQELMKAHQGCRQRRAEAHDPRGHAASDDPRPPHRSGRGAAEAGLLLRHARPGAQQGRRDRAGTANPGRQGGHGGEASARSFRMSCPKRFASRRRSRPRSTSSRRLRLLRVVQGDLDRCRRPRRDRGRQADPQAVQQGAARLLRRARPGWAGPRLG